MVLLSSDFRSSAASHGANLWGAVCDAAPVSCLGDCLANLDRFVAVANTGVQVQEHLSGCATLFSGQQLHCTAVQVSVVSPAAVPFSRQG